MFKLRHQTLVLSEKDVTDQVKGFLRVRGWRVQRQQSGLWKPGYERKDGREAMVQLGERGMSDLIALHPSMHMRRLPGVMFLEVKGPGKKPSRIQRQWLRERQIEGFLAIYVDDIEDFGKWYKRRFETP